MKKSLLNLWSLCLLACTAAVLTACGGDSGSSKCTAADIARAKPGCFGSMAQNNNNNNTPPIIGGNNNNVPPVDNPPVDNPPPVVVPGDDAGPGREPTTDAGPTPSGTCSDLQPSYDQTGAPATPCAAAAKTCVTACDPTDSDCINGCFANETEDCFNCLQNQYAVCPQYQGCDTSYAAASCCYEAKCANSTDENCFATNCKTENDAYAACYTQPGVSGVCDFYDSSYFDVCYAGGTTTEPDAGTGPTPTGTCSDPFAALPNGYTFCTASTETCLGSCPANDFTCINDCVNSDSAAPIPTRSGGQVDCGFCLGYTEQRCAALNGCGTQFSAYNCCVSDNNCTTQNCIDLNCKAQYDAFVNCIPTTTCTDDYSSSAYAVCYM